MRVSNPRAIIYVHFKLPFESSNLPGAGPIVYLYTMYGERERETEREREREREREGRLLRA